MKLHSNFGVTKQEHKKEKASELICHLSLVIVLDKIDSNLILTNQRAAFEFLVRIFEKRSPTEGDY